MKVNAFLVAALAMLPAVVMAQAPSYQVEYLGEFFVARMNDDAQMIGGVTDAGNLRGFVVGGGQAFQLLPLPEGMLSSSAVAISDLGVIVGAVGPFYSTEFQSRAAAWYPDGAGGYDVEYLGALPGQTVSRATAVNAVGDILGYSSDGQYRYPVLFTAPGGVLDLSFTGIFDPAGVNDRRVVVDGSFTVKRLDLETMVAEDLGVPVGPYLATSAAAINESNQVAGLAILTGGGTSDRVAARFTDGVGWEILSGNGPYNSASDLNDRGDLVMRVNLAAYVYLEGEGVHLIEDLIVSQTGNWYVLNTSGLTINNARQMVVTATNSATGQTGALLLTPDGTTTGVNDDVPTSAAALHPSAPNPFNPMTTLRYSLTAAGRVRLTVYSVDGGLRRVLVDEVRQPGDYAVVWDGRDGTGKELASGVYLARLEVGADAFSQKLVLAR